MRRLKRESRGHAPGAAARQVDHRSHQTLSPHPRFNPQQIQQEARLSAALAEHEETLAAVRARLAHPPSSALPADPAKAALYVAWKRALAGALRGCTGVWSERVRGVTNRARSSVCGCGGLLTPFNCPFPRRSALQPPQSATSCSAPHVAARRSCCAT